MSIVEHRKRRHRRNNDNNNFFNYRKQKIVLRDDVLRNVVFRNDQKHFLEKRESSEDIKMTTHFQKLCDILKNDISKEDILIDELVSDRNVDNDNSRNAISFKFILI